LIILLSGDSKYSVNGKDLDAVLETGRKLFILLKEGKDEDFTHTLGEIHKFVQMKGKPVEIYRSADMIIPPIKSDPKVMKSVLGIQKSP